MYSVPHFNHFPFIYSSFRIYPAIYPYTISFSHSLFRSFKSVLCICPFSLSFSIRLSLSIALFISLSHTPSFPLYLFLSLSLSHSIFLSLALCNLFHSSIFNFLPFSPYLIVHSFLHTNLPPVTPNKIQIYR